MATAYAKVRRRYKIGNPDAGRANGSFEGDYVVDGKMLGRQLCLIHHPGEAAIVWTVDELKSLSFAWRDDEDPAALYTAWEPGFSPSD